MYIIFNEHQYDLIRTRRFQIHVCISWSQIQPADACLVHHRTLFHQLINLRARPANQLVTCALLRPPKGASLAQLEPQHNRNQNCHHRNRAGSSWKSKTASCTVWDWHQVGMWKIVYLWVAARQDFSTFFSLQNILQKVIDLLFDYVVRDDGTECTVGFQYPKGRLFKSHSIERLILCNWATHFTHIASNGRCRLVVRGAFGAGWLVKEFNASRSGQ